MYYVGVVGGYDTLEGATMVRDERRIDQRFAFKFLRHALFAGMYLDENTIFKVTYR